MDSAFWEDLASDMEDPEFLREYITESIRISTIDSIMNALDEAREEAGLSKAELARAVGAEPAAVRRLFSKAGMNPTVGTLAEVAAALGLRISVEPMPASEREAVTESLRSGHATEAAIEQAWRLRWPRETSATLA